MSLSTPNNPDAERAVLSCAMQWRESYDILAQHSTGLDLFYSPPHRTIWAAMGEMTRSGLNVDLIGLTGHLRARDSLEAVGGPLTLSELASDAPTPKMLPHYLSVLEEAEKRRRVIRACHKLGADAHDPDNPVNQLIQQGDDMFTDLLKTASVARERAWTEVLGKTISQIEAARSAGGKLPGLPTGFDPLDDQTNGYGEGQMWVVAARPGAGKTALLLNLVENLVRAEHPTAIYSAEMFAEELATRSISGQSRIDSLRLARGQIDRADFGRIETALQKCINWPIWIDDRADMRLIDIQVGARKLVKQHGVKVVFVDYLQLIKEPDGSRNREDAVRRLSDGLKQLAKELGITVVALAQLNRSNERREGKRPDKSDLRDSGSIEQDANVVLLLHPLEPDATTQSVEVELIVAKCRGGKLGPILFNFDRPTTTFTAAKNEHD